MLRALIRFGINLLANAVGLIVAAAVLDDMTISGTAFVIAVGIFTVVAVITQPLIIKMSMKSAPALMGGSALVTTLVGLVITHWLSDGMSIHGLKTWAVATLIVWLAALLAGLILPVLLLKKTVVESRR